MGITENLVFILWNYGFYSTADLIFVFQDSATWSMWKSFHLAKDKKKPFKNSLKPFWEGDNSTWGNFCFYQNASTFYFPLDCPSESCSPWKMWTILKRTLLKTLSGVHSALVSSLLQNLFTAYRPCCARSVITWPQAFRLETPVGHFTAVWKHAFITDILMINWSILTGQKIKFWLTVTQTTTAVIILVYLLLLIMINIDMFYIKSHLTQEQEPETEVFMTEIYHSSLEIIILNSRPTWAQ